MLLTLLWHSLTVMSLQKVVRGPEQRGTRQGSGKGTMTRKVQRSAAFCLTQGRLSPPLPQTPAQSSSSHSATSQRSTAISISCPDKTEVSSVMLDLSQDPLSSTMLMLHILHLLKVLPDISFWPQRKYKILGPLALVSFPLVHMIHFPLVPFMVPVCCHFKCWLSALSWAFSKFTKWFLKSLSPLKSQEASQPLAEGDDDEVSHSAFIKHN